MQGELSEFSMAELLQLFALAERTGVLLVSTNSGSTRVLLESGRVIGIGLEDYDVHRDISNCELLPTRSGASLEAITPTPMTPGLSFIVRNLVEPERWELFARRCLEQQVYPYLTREHGTFEISIERVPYSPVAITLSVQQLILEGSRWTSEMQEHRQDGFGMHSMFERTATSAEEQSVNAVEWLVWSILDEPQSIERAAARIGVPDLDVASAMRRLLASGRVRRV